MKFLSSILAVVLSVSFAYSQSGRVVELSHYILPEFSEGVVLRKTGVAQKAMLNYNSLTEEMVFDRYGTKLALAKEELAQVDTVFILDRKFVLMDNKFVELLYKAETELYAEYLCKVKYPGKPAAYGGTSYTSASTSYSTLITDNQAYDLKLPDGYETNPYTFYYLKRDGKVNKFINMRQLSRLYSDKRNIFNNYVNEHNVKFEDHESMIGLIKFLEDK